MLSNGEKVIDKLAEKKRLSSLVLLERPRTVRLKFRKIGSLQYISHLDLQRTFQRVITRACIPVWYTKGFNPHAKMVFSTPLSVGAQSTYEFLDIRIDRDMPCREIARRLNAELTEELCITEAYVPTSDFSEIAWAAYRVEICSTDLNAETASRMEAILKEAPLMMTKRTKSGEKEIDLIPMIYSASAKTCGEGRVEIEVVLKASSTEYLNPELLVTAFKQKLGILSVSPTTEWYTIMRTAVMKQDMSLFF